MDGRTGRGRAAALMVAAATLVLVSACGSSGSGKTKGVAAGNTSGTSQQTNGSGSSSGQKLTDQQIYDGLLKYSKCMRAHGITKFPDPVLGQGLQVNGNSVGQGTPTYKTADTACHSLMPGGGAPKDNAPGDRAQALKYSACMRSNGVTKFPDPNPNGGLALDGDKIGMAPDNPVFIAAQKACQKYMGNAISSQGQGGQ